MKLSQSTTSLFSELKELGLPVNEEYPELISIYYEDKDDKVSIKWNRMMWPILYKDLKELNLDELKEDGVKIERTWSYIS